MKYSLRNVENDEFEWLYQLNKESYRDIVVRQFGNWDEAFQLDWFRTKWRKARPAKIITINGAAIGVVILEQRDDCDWLDEILIEAEYRGRGIGTSLLKELIADASARNRPLRLRVLHENHRAKELYERLGFVAIETLENHQLMEIE